MKKLGKLLSILGISLIILAFVFSCKDDSISAKDKRETKQKSEENFEPSLSDDGNSYWYVVAEKKDKGYKLSNIMEQNHRHFSLVEAKEEFGGGVFIVNFIQVSKETYEEQQ